MTNSDNKSPLVKNLLALRHCLLMSFLGVFVCVAGLFPFWNIIFHYACAPLLDALPQGSSLLAVGVVSPVLGPLRIVLFSAFALSLPFTLYEIWSFVAPGLYKKEKKVSLLFVFSAFLMFVLGTCYCYFVVFSFLFPFIASFAPQSVSFAPDIDAYISFMLRMFLSFGLAFETPVAVCCLSVFKLISTDALRHGRRYVIVGAFAVAAVMTPPDVTSQLLLALPLIALYELGILIAAVFLGRNSESKALRAC